MRHFKTAASKPSRSNGLPRSRMRKEKGTALIVSLLLIVLLTLLAVNGLNTSILEEQMSGNQKMAAKALFAAEQGVSEAISDLLDQTISDVGQEESTTWVGVGSASGVGYSVDYTVRHHTVGGSIVANDAGRTYYLINSTGNASEGSRRMVEVVVASDTGGSPHVAGLIGCDGVKINNNPTTASYSSSGAESNGDRGDIQTTNLDAAITVYNDADINGELRSTGTLILDSNSIIRRDAFATTGIEMLSQSHVYGSAWTNAAYTGGYSHVTGDINQGPTVTPDPIVELTPCDPLDLDTIFADVDSIKTTNNNAELTAFCPGPGALCFDDATGTFFSSGTDAVTIGVTGVESDYLFYDFIADSDSTVTILGTVRFFVENNFKLIANSQLIFDPGATLKIYHEGQVDGDDNALFFLDSNTVANDLGITSDFQLYSKAFNEEKEPGLWEVGKEKITVNSNSGFYGLIYAPRAHVVINSNTSVHGSVRGSYITMDSNAAFWFDEDLDNLFTSIPIDYELVYWAEFYPE